MRGITSVSSTLSLNRVLMSPWLSLVHDVLLLDECFVHCFFIDNIMKEVVPAGTDDEEMFSVFNVGSFDSKVKQKQDKLFFQSPKETASSTVYSPGK